MIQNLIHWYHTQDRSLPWRQNAEPYNIWLSEIILQQTRIAQGLPYYQKLLNAYPTVHKLAKAPEDELYAHWQGLGYYSRCRNLHRTAQIIDQEHEGIFPTSYSELLQLPGIGPYTAAAISSICYAEPQLAIDGNVQRVLARLYAVTETINTPAAKKIFKEIGSQIMEDDHPGDINQALMDLGSQICTPRSPLCSDCPVSQHCMAYRECRTDELPVVPKKKAKKNHYLHYKVIRNKDQVWLTKRTQKGIWQNLYEFSKVHDAETPYEGETEAQLEHNLTHKKLHISFDEVHEAASQTEEGIWVAQEDLDDYALPVPLRKWWEGQRED